MLLHTLIDDLGRPDEEVAARVAETREGRVADISHEELVAGLMYLPKG